MSEQPSIPTTAKLPSTAPAGYAAPAHITLQSEAEDLAATASAVLADPVALLRLCDRIADLMAQDLRLQRDRNSHYSWRR